MADAGGFIEWVTGEPESEALADLRGIVIGGIVGAIAGGLGTLAFSVVLYIAIVLGAFEPAQFGELAGLAGIGDPIVGEGNPLVGYLIFLGGGMTTWPFLFAALHHYLPGWRMTVSGITFAAIGWTGFSIAFYSGQTGTSLLLFLVLTFVGQCLYGLVLGLVFEYAEPRVDVAFVGTTFQ
jgi:cytochrome c oxidase subunit 1